MIAGLLLALSAGSGIELGAGAGLGRILGDGVSAPGRDAATVDAMRDPVSWDGWVGYEWMDGHLLGMRYQAWKASGRLDGMADLGADAKEELDLSVWGFEYTRMLGRDPVRWRVGGGLGFAEAADEVRIGSSKMSAEGSGMAFWLRGGLQLPAGPLRFHLDGAGVWISFSRMKSEKQDSYETSYPLVQVEAALSYAL